MCRGISPSHQHMAACEVYNYAKIIHGPDINKNECTHTPFLFAMPFYQELGNPHGTSVVVHESLDTRKHNFCLHQLPQLFPCVCKQCSHILRIKFSNFAFAGRSVVTQRTIAWHHSNFWLGPTGTSIPRQRLVNNLSSSVYS